MAATSRHWANAWGTRAASRWLLRTVAALVVGTSSTAWADPTDPAEDASEPLVDVWGDESDAPSTPTSAPLAVAHEAPSTPVASAPVDTTTAAPVAHVPTEIFDHLEAFAFADVYLAEHWTLADGFSGNHGDVMPHRAYDVMGGPALSFIGVDVRYVPRPIGATLAVRFGSSMSRLMGPTTGLPDGLQFIKQAFVSFRPIDELQVDFGTFDTPYGAEVSESWLNPNYTRGSLYTVLQPYYHTGFRVVWTPTPQWTVTALAVNGWNNFADNNDGKTGGFQLAYSEGIFSGSIGYLTGPEGVRNDRFRHFWDAIFRVTGHDAMLILNANALLEDTDAGLDSAWGFAAIFRSRFGHDWAAALRGEFLGDPDTGHGLATGTITLEWMPDPMFDVRLDNRLDFATDAHFVDQTGAPSSVLASTILGVVVHTNG